MSAICLRMACLTGALLAPIAVIGATATPFDVPLGSSCEQIRLRLGNPPPSPPPPGGGQPILPGLRGVWAPDIPPGRTGDRDRMHQRQVKMPASS